MTVFVRRNAVVPQRAKMQCRRFCGFTTAELENVTAHLQESTTPKRWFYPTRSYTGIDAHNRPNVHFHMQYRLLRGCLSLNCRQCGGFNMTEKIMSLVQQASPFVPQRQLVRAYP